MTGVRVDRELGLTRVRVTGILLASIGFCGIPRVPMGAMQKVWVKTLHQDVAGKKKTLRGSRGY